MADIFLSHSSADNEAADQIKAWLERDRSSWSVFLDKHSRDGIVAGQGWQDCLRAELQSCRLVLAIITPHWLGSRWCFAEAVTATFRGKDFVGVVTEDLTDDVLAAAPPIVHERQRQPLDLNTGAGWEELLYALDRSGLDPNEWFPIPEGVGPYPGFVAFEEKDAGVFFGRNQEITQYLEELNLLKAPGRAQALVISGGSGSGKSSLLKAGLIPRLRRQPDWEIVPPFDPSREPIHALFAALRATAMAAGADIELPRTPPAGVDELTTYVQDSLRSIEEATRAWLLLPLDQAEVLLAGSKAGTETDASNLLAAVSRILASRTRKLVAVFTIRTEFLPALERTTPAEVRLQDRSLRPVTALSEVIEKPAERFGIELEKGLTGRMVEDTGGSGGLPLLAYTLRELNEKYGKNKLLTVAEYEDLGGVEGAIEKKLHEALKNLQPTADELVAFRRCFVRQLVRVDEGAVEGERYLRAAIHRESFPSAAERLIDGLHNARLLVGSDDGTIAIAHERLIRDWAGVPLKTWLAEDSDDRRLIDTLKSFLAAHSEGGPLLTEKPLLDAKDLLERDLSLKDDETELEQFIRESVRAEQRRRLRRKWQFGGATAAAIVFAAVAAGTVRLYLVAEERAIEAETSLAWSMLAFSQEGMTSNDARGLWAIATADPEVKFRSHLLLRDDGHYADRFARRPGEVIRALSLASDPEVHESLRRLINSRKPHVRKSAIEIARSLGATVQATSIIKHLTDEEEDVRRAAGAALEDLASTDHAAAVAHLFEHDIPYVRATAVKLLGRLGENEQAPKIAERLADENENVRRHAVEALAMLEATEQVLSIVTRLARHENPHTRLAAVRAFGKLGSRDQAPYIAERLADEDDSVRQAAVVALGDVGSSDHAPVIAQLLSEDESAALQRVAVEALVKLGATRYAGAIAERLAARDEKLRRFALATLKDMGAIGMTAIAGLLNTDKGPRMRRVAVDTLADLDATDHAAAIAARLDDENKWVQVAAVKALAKLKAYSHAAAVAARLADEDPEVRKAAVKTLAKLGATEFSSAAELGATDYAAAIAGLLAVEEDSKVSQAAVDALAELDARDHASLIAARLTPNRPQAERRAAVKALMKLKAKSQSAALAALLNDKDSYVTKAAIRALGQLCARDQSAAIAALLRDQSVGQTREVRQAAVEALAKLDASDHAAVIVDYIFDDAQQVSDAAVEALVKLKATNQAAPIAERLADTTENKRVRRLALKALVALDARDQIPAIAKLLAEERPDKYLLTAAVQALGTLDAADQIPAIVKLLTDPSFTGYQFWQLRIDAITALAELGAPVNTAAIAVNAAAIAGFLSDDRPEVAQAAIEALLELEVATTHAAAITKLFAHPYGPVRAAAVKALMELDSNNQVTRLAAYLTHESEWTRKETVEVLFKLRAINQASAIAELLADDRYAVRRAAVEALTAFAAFDVTEEWRRDLVYTIRRQLMIHKSIPKSGQDIAEAIVAISAKMKPERALAELVEALKHPVLGGYEPTQILLRGLKDRFPDAPGPDRGLYPNLNWISSTFPNIDLKSPPRGDPEFPVELVSNAVSDRGPP